MAADMGKRADQCAHNVSGLIPNSNYIFRVRAFNAYGRGHEASRPSSECSVLTVFVSQYPGKCVCAHNN